MEKAEHLRNADWEKIGPVLVAFAGYLARCYRWGSDARDTLALGMAAEDIAGLAIRKLWSGERNWDPQAQPDLLWVLKGIVRSEMGHLFHTSAARAEKRFPSDEDGRDPESRLAAMRSSAPPGSDLESELIGREEDHQAGRRIQRLRSALRGHPELLEIVDAIQGGCEGRPRHLAAELGAEVPEINNRLKRLRRVALNLERKP